MKAIRVEYDEKDQRIDMDEAATAEDWARVCERYGGDVHRVSDTKDQGSYTGLYQCFDDDNNAEYYLVEEDRALYKARHINMLRNLGLGR